MREPRSRRRLALSTAAWTLASLLMTVAMLLFAQVERGSTLGSVATAVAAFAGLVTTLGLLLLLVLLVFDREDTDQA